MIRLKVILFGIFLATGLSTQSSAQTAVLIHNSEFQKDAVTAIDSLYNRNTDASREVMSSWKQSHPDHPIWTMWDAMEVWWEVLEDLYDHSLDDKLMEMMQRSEYQAGRILSRESGHPDALIIRALANGYIARHYANRGHWVTSVRTARRAYVTYQELMDVEPDFIDNEFVRGMISYYADYIPDEYPAVRVVSWFLPDGDRVEGLKKINRAAEEGIFSRPEATYFMGNILLNYERDYSAAHGHFQRLIDQYPDNSYYRRLMVRTLSNQGRNQEVLTQVNNAIEHWEMQGRYNDRVMLEELRFWEGEPITG